MPNYNRGNLGWFNLLLRVKNLVPPTLSPRGFVHVINFHTFPSKMPTNLHMLSSGGKKVISFYDPKIIYFQLRKIFFPK